MYYTDRLMLRAFDLRVDEPKVTQMFNDVEIMWATFPEVPRPGQYSAKKFIEGAIEAGKNGLPSFAICLKPEQKEHPSQLGPNEDLFVKDGLARYPMIGLLSLGGLPGRMSFVNRVVGFGISFDEHHRGKGYGFELLSWAIDYLFNDLNVHKCECMVSSENSAAIHLYEKIGLVREGTFRQRYWRNGKWIDDHTYGMLENEWRARKSKS